MNKIELIRTQRIREIKKTIEEAKIAGKEIDEIKFLLQIQSEYGISKRTAKEYLEVARFENGI